MQARDHPAVPTCHDSIAERHGVNFLGGSIETRRLGGRSLLIATGAAAMVVAGWLAPASAAAEDFVRVAPDPQQVVEHLPLVSVGWQQGVEHLPPVSVSVSEGRPVGPGVISSSGSFYPSGANERVEPRPPDVHKPADAPGEHGKGKDEGNSDPSLCGAVTANPVAIASGEKL